MKERKPHHLPESAVSESGGFDNNWVGGGKGRPAMRSVHPINGATGGRPRVKIDLDPVRQLLADGHSIKAIARELRVGEGTLRRALGLVDVHQGLSGPPAPRQKPKAEAL